MTGILGGLIATYKKIVRAVTWTTRSMSETIWPRGVAYFEVSGLYYIVGQKGTSGNELTTNIYTRSSNGTTWADSTFPSSIRAGRVDTSPTKIIVMSGGSDNIINNSDTIAFTSTNGTTWTSSTTTRSQAIYDSQVVGETFYYVGTGGRVMYTSNGTTWNETALRSGVTSEGLAVIKYENGLWVIMREDATSTYYTTTGDITDVDGWTARTLPASITAGCLTYGAGLWLLTRNGSTTYYTSPDAITWTSRTLPLATRTKTKVGYGNDLFFYFSTTGSGTNGSVRVSSDGISWSNALTITDLSSRDWAVGPTQIIGAGVDVSSATTTQAIGGSY